MAFVIADRVRETTTTIGTGSVTLGGAYTSFQTFSAAIGNGNNTYYTIASAATGEWEVGIGTYSSGPNSLSRDTVLASSAGGAAVSFSVGSKDVFVTQPAERSLLINSASNGLFAGNAAFTTNGIPYANSTTTLTTGSALTFDGQNLSTGSGSFLANGTTGITSFRATTTSNYAELQSRPDISYSRVLSSAYLLDIATLANQPILFTVQSSEQMRLTSTGLGIGTSSPSEKLQVTGNILQTWAASHNRFIGTQFSTTYENGLRFLESSRETQVIAKAADTGGLITFFTGTGPSERMRLDGSGNLGIGTSSPGAKLHIAAAAVTGTVDRAEIIANSSASGVGSGSEIYIGWNQPSSNAGGGVTLGGVYDGTGTAMVFSTPSGISSAPTERARITSAGNFVAGGSVALATTATDGFLYVPTCAGTPTGTPTTITGMAPIVVNTTNNKLYFYSGGAWRDAGP